MAWITIKINSSFRPLAKTLLITITERTIYRKIFFIKERYVTHTSVDLVLISNTVNTIKIIIGKVYLVALTLLFNKRMNIIDEKISHIKSLLSGIIIFTIGLSRFPKKYSCTPNNNARLVHTNNNFKIILLCIIKKILSAY